MQLSGTYTNRGAPGIPYMRDLYPHEWLQHWHDTTRQIWSQLFIPDVSIPNEQNGSRQSPARPFYPHEWFQYELHTTESSWKRHQKLTSFMHTQYKELRLCLATPHFQIKISRRNWLWNSTYWIGDNNKDLGQEPASQSEEEAATTANSKANKPDSSSQECAHLTHNIKQSLFFFSCSFRFL